MIVNGFRQLMPRSSRTAGFTLVEMLVVVAILSILAVVVAPKILGSREKAMSNACLAAFHAMDAELSNRVSRYESLGDPQAAAKSIAEVVTLQDANTAANPRNRAEPAYVDGGAGPVTPSADTSCQVFLVDATPTSGTDRPPTVTLWQYEAGAVRSARITMN